LKVDDRVSEIEKRKREPMAAFAVGEESERPSIRRLRKACLRRRRGRDSGGGVAVDFGVRRSGQGPRNDTPIDAFDDLHAAAVERLSPSWRGAQNRKTAGAIKANAARWKGGKLEGETLLSRPPFMTPSHYI